MDKLANLTGFSSGNKSLSILHAQNELEKKKKTYRSVNLGILPDKGAKLKNTIDELENLLQTMTLDCSGEIEVGSSVVSSSRHENISAVKKSSSIQHKEAIHDDKNLQGSSGIEEKSNKSAACKIEDKPKKSAACKIEDKPKKSALCSQEEEQKQKKISGSGKENYESASFVNKDKHGGAVEASETPKPESMPFSKFLHDSGSDKCISFSDLTPKHKEKNVKDDVMSSPSFKSWRQPGEIHKTLLTEPKPLIENPTKKSNLLNYYTLNPIPQASEECVRKIHASLATYPDDYKEELEPENLQTMLMLHQKRGLAWMMWREDQDPKGGILADDMGLGKTLSVIALILKQKERKDFCSRRDHDFECKGTLVVCSASLIHQWNDEIIKHCEIDAFKILLYHGPKRDKDFKKMKSYDVVITTYNIVQQEKKKLDMEKTASPLFRLKFERIVLDEAHTIKNHASQTAEAIFSLKSFRKWAVTGTPIHNVFKDIYSLVKFLQFSPFDDLKKFKRLTDDSADTNEQRRNLLIKNMVLRRTKDQVDEWGKPLIAMKNKSFALHYIELSEEERKTYDALSDKIKNKFCRYLEKTSKLTSGGTLLTLLLRLQQCCNHLSLLKKEAELPHDPSDVADALSALTIDESSSNSVDSGLDLTFSILDDDKLDTIASKSTKMAELFKELHKISESSDNKDKSVIVSQWVSMLDIVAFHLNQEKVAYHLIAGSTKVEDRQKFADDFNYNENGARIMLLSLRAGGVGLNLIGANHLFLLDLHWNPALEMQACDRIHRVGQKKDVIIHKFICRNTIEEKINELQNSKRTIASNALKGTKHDTEKLTIDDYKMLFGIMK